MMANTSRILKRFLLAMLLLVTLGHTLGYTLSDYYKLYDQLDEEEYRPFNRAVRAPFNSWGAFRSWGHHLPNFHSAPNTITHRAIDIPTQYEMEKLPTTEEIKRAPFSSWAGKRAPFNSWAGKRAPFNSWAGKRARFMGIHR